MLREQGVICRAGALLEAAMLLVLKPALLLVLPGAHLVLEPLALHLLGEEHLEYLCEVDVWRGRGRRCRRREKRCRTRKMLTKGCRAHRIDRG